MDNGSLPKLNLALGGGGARGLAHIGVLKVLEKAGLPIGFLAGTSMGGLIGALYAAGWTAQQLEAEALALSSFRNLVKLVDLAPARRGLLEGQRVREQLNEMLGENLTFDQLPKKLALIAVDLCTAQEVILRQGPVVEAVLATTAVPGLLPPVYSGDCHLVDGGILNNVPADVARANGNSPVIAIDVSPTFPLRPPGSSDNTDKLWPAIFPQFAQDFYTAELIMVSALTSARLEQTPPDLLIKPPIPPSISIFWGLTLAPEAIAAGEQAAIEALPAIETLLKRYAKPDP
jgi:NTE family protein